MEEVTDVVFRRVVARAGRPDVFMTEFINVDGFCHPSGRDSIARRLEFWPTEQPIVAQIWGKNPQNFFKTAAELARLGFAGVDINMGCPDRKVVRSGGGVGLIQTPDLAIEIIAAVKAGWAAGKHQHKTNRHLAKSSNQLLPVSVKTRLGYASVLQWRDWLTTPLGQNLANLTVHLRTKKELSKAPAHYELIADIVELRDELSPATRLTINGDIADRQQARSLQQKFPGVNGLMIGRGVFANPFCFTDRPNPTGAELLDLLNYHLDLFDQYEKAKFDPLKRFFKVYVKDFAGAAELRARLMDSKTTAEVRQILKNHAQRNSG
jgi:tRNA-dihydrouridine synthase